MTSLWPPLDPTLKGGPLPVHPDPWGIASSSGSVSDSTLPSESTKVYRLCVSLLVCLLHFFPSMLGLSVDLLLCWRIREAIEKRMHGAHHRQEHFNENPSVAIDPQVTMTT